MCVIDLSVCYRPQCVCVIELSVVFRAECVYHRPECVYYRAEYVCYRVECMCAIELCGGILYLYLYDLLGRFPFGP